MPKPEDSLESSGFAARGSSVLSVHITFAGQCWDAGRLIDFYKKVLKCQSIGEKRDLRGEWLDKMTGIDHAHITREHLVVPGYAQDHPTIEIFSYDEMKERIPSEINRPGITHLAFEVDDVMQTLHEIVENGGSALGEVVTADYPNHQTAVFVYAKDPEGNILELQSWSAR